MDGHDRIGWADSIGFKGKHSARKWVAARPCVSDSAVSSVNRSGSGIDGAQPSERCEFNKQIYVLGRRFDRETSNPFLFKVVVPFLFKLARRKVSAYKEGKGGMFEEKFQLRR